MKNINVPIFSAVQSFPLIRETIRAGASALAGGVAVMRNGSVAAAGTKAAGITLYDVDAGELVAIGLNGIVCMKVTAAATIDADDPITVGVGGTAAKAAGTDAIIGRSLDLASGASVSSPRFIRVSLG